MTDETKAAWARDLIRDEGTGPIIKGRLMPYTDTAGYLTLGFGRCIELRGISLEEAHYMLMADMHDVLQEMAQAFPWALDMNDTRQSVLASMLFNLGATKLRTFHATLAAMKAGEYLTAAWHMRNSKWYTQVKGRAVRLANQMETGQA